MKTLMHICCAPCANRPIAALREEGASSWPASGTIPISTPIPSTRQPKNLPGGLRQGDLPPTGDRQ